MQITHRQLKRIIRQESRQLAEARGPKNSVTNLAKKAGLFSGFEELASQLKERFGDARDVEAMLRDVAAECVREAVANVLDA